MTKIAKQLTELIGKTPLLELNKFSKSHGIETPIIAKVEFFNFAKRSNAFQSI